MKILLHMGQEKTGTTALQQSLHSAADELRARGILYPRFGGHAIAHHLLLPLQGDPKRLPPWTLSDLGGPEAAVEKARLAWEATLQEMRVNPPDVLILSSELLLNRTDGPAKARLARALASLSDDVVPILYVRHPVDHYRSLLQEMLKAESRPFPPVSTGLRQAIEDTEAAFSNPPVLVAYDRTTLAQGDIVRDFANRFLMPGLGGLDLPPSQANRGLSAEALVLTARLREEGGPTVEAARRVAKLRPHMEEFDRTDPPARPLTLRPEVAEAALRSATCHRWLVTTGRLEIPGLDISRIDGAAVPDWMMTAAPETLFPHDPDRLARLRQVIDDRVTTMQRRQQRRDAEAERPAPRLVDRLLRALKRKAGQMGGTGGGGGGKGDL